MSSLNGFPCIFLEAFHLLIILSPIENPSLWNQSILFPKTMRPIFGMKCFYRGEFFYETIQFLPYCQTEQNANKVHGIVNHEFETNARIRNAEIFLLTKYCSLFCNCFWVDKTDKNSEKPRKKKIISFGLEWSLQWGALDGAWFWHKLQ